MKPQKPEPNKSTAEIVRMGKDGEFWKIISAYLANEIAELSYGIIKKNYNGKDLDEAKLDALRRNLDFVEWHIKLPDTILSSYEAKEPEIPNYDPYPNVGDKD